MNINKLDPGLRRGDELSRISLMAYFLLFTFHCYRYAFLQSAQIPYMYRQWSVIS